MLEVAIVKQFSKKSVSPLCDIAALVARMAESRARTGPFAHQDRILDVAITLEQMYELDSGEISFKLRARAACFPPTTPRNENGSFTRSGISTTSDQPSFTRDGHQKNRENCRPHKT